MSTPPDTVSTTAARERLTWIVELMSRYAREKQQSHDSARLAAAIVNHLKALAAAVPDGSPLAQAASHWLDAWEPILDGHLARSGATTTAATPSLLDLVQRARYA